jgi:signal transduction histidine kinase
VTGDQDREPSPELPKARENPDCLIDASGLEFVLDNLVSNSIQAMRQATSKILEITWSSGDGMIRIEVRDTGCGIPRDDWRRALETHFTTKDGGGMGLLNSRKFLRRFCGDLQILSSEPGKSTTVQVTVPEA